MRQTRFSAIPVGAKFTCHTVGFIKTSSTQARPVSVYWPFTFDDSLPCWVK